MGDAEREGRKVGRILGRKEEKDKMNQRRIDSGVDINFRQGGEGDIHLECETVERQKVGDASSRWMTGIRSSLW